MTVRFDFRGRTVIVTGAGRGIGFELARAFGVAGATVGLLDVDNESVERAAAEVDGGLPLVASVADGASVVSAFATLVEATGRLDVLVNNAGILRDRMMWKLMDEDWSAVIAVHLTGTFNCTRAVTPTMREAGYGRIVNVTSYTGLHGNVGQANYAAAKAGIIGFTKTCAKELAPYGITVNAVSPNARTTMVDSIPSAQLELLKAQIPMRRFAEPEEMAPAVAFLASEEAGYITGVVLPIDGGLSM